MIFFGGRGAGSYSSVCQLELVCPDFPRLQVSWFNPSSSLPRAWAGTRWWPVQWVDAKGRMGRGRMRGSRGGSGKGTEPRVRAPGPALCPCGPCGP